MHYDAALGREPEDQPACLARLYRKKANTYRIQLEFDRALETYLAAEAALEASQTRGVTWRQEWIQIQLERTWLRYWQGAWDAVTKLDQEIRPQVERFGTLAQQVNFFNALAVMSLRRQRYLHPLEALAYTRTAYEKSLESENPHDIAWSAFTHGFSLLWCDDYGQAEELMRTALTLARENGDFVHQARCLTYLAIAYRKQGQVDLTRHFTTMSLKTAKKTKMLEYAGTAHGNLAWLAWHDGNYDLVEAEGRQAFAEWDQVGSQHASITFKWTAIWPLIALAVRRERLAEAIDYAKQLLEPGQQRLPDAPRRAVERAVYAWSEDRPADARSELLAALNGSDLRPLPSGVLIDGERTVAGADAQPARTGAAIALTSREAEVLQLIAAGLSNKEIAERLVVEVSTVKKHINHLFGKLDVDSRTRAIVRAQELNLI
jgi:ATP/maltotriose-dependent transcriptional regulator MalT